MVASACLSPRLPGASDAGAVHAAGGVAAEAGEGGGVWQPGPSHTACQLTVTCTFTRFSVIRVISLSESWRAR